MIPKVLILTGPSAAGKNTIAAEYAQRTSSRCAVVDVDVLRWMVLKPHVAPWHGDEGRKQHRLGVENACNVAKNFCQEGFDVLILDIVSEEHAHVYKGALAFAHPRIIRLMPTYEEVLRRNDGRLSVVLRPEEIDFLYEMQRDLRSFDLSIDNSEIPAREIAEKLLLLQ
jgi:hypothetical protein